MRTLALLLCGIETADIETLLWQFKSAVSGFYGNVNEGWDESSVVHCIPVDWKSFSLYHLLIECCSTDLEVGSAG